MTLARFVVRELRGRPGRAALTLLGIVIGVATVVSVHATTRAARDGLHGMFDAVSGKAPFEVVADGGAGLDPGLGPRLEELPGVAAAVPTVQAPAALATPAGTRPVLLVGIDPARDREVRRYVLAQGTLLGSPGLVLERGFARELGLTLGQGAVLLTTQGPAKLPVVGLLEPEGAAALLGGNVAFTGLDDARRLAGLGERVSALHLVPAEGVGEVDLRRQVEAALPPGAVLQRPASRGELAVMAMSGTELGLENAAVLSVVLGAFIILNTFLMNLGERRGRLATLRAVGATRGQVGRMILLEALLLGSAGAALGVPAGLGVSWVIAAGMERLLLVPIARPGLDLDAVALGLLLGPGVAALAAAIPAVAARDVSPLELGRRDAPAGEAGRRWPAALGGACLLVATAVGVGLITGRLGPAWSALGTALGLGAVVLVAPALMRPLAGGLALVARLAPDATRTLALRQLLRRPLRNSLTVGVVAAALAMSIGMGNALLTNVQGVRDFADRTIVGDFIVRAAMPDPTLVLVPPLPEALGRELAAIDGVREVRPVKFAQVRVDGQRAMLTARALPADGALHLDVLRGDPRAVRAGMERGEVAIGLRLARALKKDVGDVIVIHGPDGPRETRVAAVITELTGGGMAIFAEWSAARRLLRFKGVDVFLIDAARDRRDAVGASLAALTRPRGLLLQSHASFRELLDRMTGGVVASLWGLLAVLFVTAAFGVVNTLTMNVLEQTRELGLLRAVAMTRAQVRRTVVAQAGAMAAIAVVPGGLLGLGLAGLMNAASPALLGVDLALTFHGAFIAAALVVAVLVTVCAGWVPAVRASRLDVVEALKYE